MMDRRRFLGMTTGLAATSIWPQWLQRAFGVEEDEPQSAPHAPGLDAAYDEARRLGKPLLVLVIPEDNRLKWDRGHLFGELFNHGSDEQLAPLALCEVVCATRSELRPFVPSVPGEPLMALLETDGSKPRLLDGLVPPSSEGAVHRAQAVDWDERRTREDRLVEQRIAFAAGLVRTGLLPDAVTLARRAAQSVSSLQPEERDAVRGLLESAFPDKLQFLGVWCQPEAPPCPELLLVDRAAALFARRADKASGAERDALEATLAAVAAARLRLRRIPGSHWASSSGCGIRVEDRPDLSEHVACGMGHVPTKSRRFLYFFTQPSPGG